jgi:hypothetical protein
MAIPKFIDNAIDYISGAMSRIFGLSDDAYPNTGVQPFEGETRKKSRSANR